MPVTPRSLRRRLHANPGAVKIGAGVLAGAIGMTTAAYGVLHIVVPYKGNYTRSDTRTAPDEPASPTADLVNTLLALVPTELPAEDGSDSLASFSLDGTSALVTSVVDSVSGSPNGAASPGSGGGNTGGNNNGGGGLFGNIGDGPTWTPPGDDGGEHGMDVPGLSHLTPGVPLPALALEGEEECPPQEEAPEEPSAINPHLPGLAPETEPACEEEPATEEEAPAEEAPAEEEQVPEAPGQKRR